MEFSVQPLHGEGARRDDWTLPRLKPTIHKLSNTVVIIST